MMHFYFINLSANSVASSSAQSSLRENLLMREVTLQPIFIHS